MREGGKEGRRLRGREGGREGRRKVEREGGNEGGWRVSGREGERERIPTQFHVVWEYILTFQFSLTDNHARSV